MNTDVESETDMDRVYRMPRALPLIAALIIFGGGMVAVFLTLTDWIARQTWAVILTGMVVIWYTWETMQLRYAAHAQRELQLRPFVVLEPLEHGFQIHNLGPGTALNVHVEDVTISQEDQIFVRFPERVPVLASGEKKDFAATSFHGEAEAGEFFTHHLEPEFAIFDLPVQVVFQDVEMHSFQVLERVTKGKLEITGFTGGTLSNNTVQPTPASGRG